MAGNPLIWVLIVPRVLPGAFAQLRVKSAVARHVLNARGLSDVAASR